MTQAKAHSGGSPADAHVPPQNGEAEEQMLGAMLISQGAVEAVLDEVKVVPEDAYLDRHKLLLGSMAKLHAAGKPVLEVTVAEDLEERKLLEDAGGKDYLYTLPAKVGAIGNAKHHAEAVKRLAHLYRLRKAGLGIAEAVDNRRGDDAEDLHQKAAALLDQARPPAAQSKARLLSIPALAKLPKPEFLVEDMVAAKGFNVLFGPSGGGKTLLTLDFSWSIETGRSWYGRAVKQCPVAYIAGEGASGIYARYLAWKKARGVDKDPEDFHVFPEAVNFYTGDTGGLVTAIDALERAPGLIVVDTMARCMVGGDENLARDVGMFIAEVDRVRSRYGAAALIVHHAGKNGELERGSTALRGAADTMISLKPDGAGLKLACEKQKDAAEFDPWFLHLEEVGESVSIGLGTNTERMTPQEVQILESVPASFGTDWVSATKIRDVADVPKSSFYRALKSLCQRGFIEERPVTDTRSEYRITEAGLTAVPDRPKQSLAPDRSLSHRLHPFRGGTDSGTNGLTGDASAVEEQELARLAAKFEEAV